MLYSSRSEADCLMLRGRRALTRRARRAAHLAMAGYLRCRDAGRPVHYEGGGSRTAATDFVCPMYARVHQARARASCAVSRAARATSSLGTCAQLRPTTGPAN